MFAMIKNSNLGLSIQTASFQSWAKRLLLATYILCVLGFSMTSRAGIGHFPMPAGTFKNFDVVQFQGTLLAANDGHSAKLIVGEVVVAELQVTATSKINFVDFHNLEVKVIGAISKTNIQPVTMGFTGGANHSVQAQKGKAIPTVFVINIIGAAQ